MYDCSVIVHTVADYRILRIQAEAKYGVVDPTPYITQIITERRAVAITIRSEQSFHFPAAHSEQSVVLRKIVDHMKAILPLTPAPLLCVEVLTGEVVVDVGGHHPASGYEDDEEEYADAEGGDSLPDRCVPA